MTNRVAIWLALVIAAVYAADRIWLHWDLPILIGRYLVGLIDYLAFWR